METHGNQDHGSKTCKKTIEIPIGQRTALLLDVPRGYKNSLRCSTNAGGVSFISN